MENSNRHQRILIEEAISISSGTRAYQIRMLLILSLGLAAISPINMCMQFYLPKVTSDLQKNTPENQNSLKSSVTYVVEVFEKDQSNFYDI